MKKISILSLAFILTATLFAYSQENTRSQNDSIKKENKKNDGQVGTEVFTRKDYSHWSLFLDLGLNTFIGDMSVDLSPTFKKPLEHWNIGGGIEYTINPMFSLGLGYTFHRIGAEDQGGSFESRVHNIYPFMSINLLNYALFKRNNKWDLWFSVGFGYAHYKPELTYLRGTLTEETRFNKNSTGAGVIPLGVELSYDITRQLAIALKMQYFMYTHDDLEGAKSKFYEPSSDGRKNYTYSGVTNDYIASFDISLRWNITGSDKTHMRKLTWRDYVPKEPNLNDILARLDSLEDRVDNPPIIITEFASSVTCVIEPVFIYFDFDKYDLKHAALAEILKVATILYEHEDLEVEIIGYTDIKGTDPYNDRLSKRRADAARDELVNIWQISPDRIIDEGRGKALSPKPELDRYHSINRRCEFRFYKKNND